MIKKLSEKKIKKIKTLYLKGWSQRKTAKAVGCSRSAVWYHLQKIKNK